MIEAKITCSCTSISIPDLGLKLSNGMTAYVGEIDARKSNDLMAAARAGAVSVNFIKRATEVKQPVVVVGKPKRSLSTGAYTSVYVPVDQPVVVFQPEPPVTAAQPEPPAYEPVSDDQMQALLLHQPYIVDAIITDADVPVAQVEKPASLKVRKTNKTYDSIRQAK